MRAVVLLSGGLDSTTAAALARREGWELYGLTLRYGQVHARELEAARRIAATLGFVKHVELDVDLRAFGGSSLTGDGAIPKDRALDATGGSSNNPIAQLPDSPIPSTYVPARNTVFLSLALAWSEVLDAERIVIGVNALDYSGYPDCRPEFIAAFDLGLDYGLTHSCYDPGPDGRPCGRCDSCQLRARGFAEAGVADPLLFPGA
jgi:7-cyano-7-deazaguanine synthase